MTMKWSFNEMVFQCNDLSAQRSFSVNDFLLRTVRLTARVSETVFQCERSFSLKNKIMSKRTPIYTGTIQRDEYNNYYCGEFLLDYRYTEAGFKIGDRIDIFSSISNPSDMSAGWYPQKTKDFKLSDQEAK
jgi:hypothetical protein